MLFASILFFGLNIARGADISFQATAWSNLDKTFKPYQEKSILGEFTYLDKVRFKSAGIFYFIRPKIEYKHDFEANRLREGELSTNLLIIRPAAKNLFGASISTGHNWQWKRDFNVNTNTFQELDLDHFFADINIFAERKMGAVLTGEVALRGRIEDYASAYSVYVNQQNDNILAGFNAGLSYKKDGYEVKPTLSFVKRLWRERRALSKDGFFVSPGEELKPDRIDTTNYAVLLKKSLKFVNISLVPNYTVVSDLNNGGRSLNGEGASLDTEFPHELLTTKLITSWQKRNYSSQLSSFQFSGGKKLEEETFTLKVGLSKKLGSWLSELSHGMDKSISNQLDSSRRRIGIISSSFTSLALKKMF